ncbi:MAG: hypothetical protein M1827_004996 [Pycnora praestabilis]|nr:MAG: hypothetical protein M1827_004996 [Pycnora praestabilis]
MSILPAAISHKDIHTGHAEPRESHEHSPTVAQPAPSTIVGSTKATCAAHPPQSGTQPNLFTALQSSPSLQHLFTTYPNLRTQLHTIYTSTLEPSPEDLETQHSRYRGRNRFDRGRGRGGRGGRIRGGEGSNKRSNGPWTPERGTKAGLYTIKKVRERDGAEGEGMREFVELVLKLCRTGEAEEEEAIREGDRESDDRDLAALLGDGRV